MARPRKDGMDYFPHDTDAVSDTKIEALRMLYGNDGYAFYFILLEIIYKQPNFELDVSDAETTQILSKKIEVTQEKFDNMLKTAIKRGCFDREAYVERGVLTSEGILKRSKVVVEKRERMRKKPDATRDSELLKDNGQVSAAETMAESAQSKVKEKESKSKEKEYIKESSSTEPEVFVNPTLQEVYAKQTGQFIMPEPLKNFFRQIRGSGQDEQFCIELLMEGIESSSNGKVSLNFLEKIKERWLKEKITSREQARKKPVETKRHYSPRPHKPEIPIVQAQEEAETAAPPEDYEKWLELAKQMQKGKGGANGNKESA